MEDKSAFEKAVEEATGLTIDQIQKMTLPEMREYFDKKRLKENLVSLSLDDEIKDEILHQSIRYNIFRYLVLLIGSYALLEALMSVFGVIIFFTIWIHYGLYKLGKFMEKRKIKTNE